MKLAFTINGQEIEIDVDPDTPLLDVLRNDLELNGPKFGCGLAQCGACAVSIGGKSVRSCVTPVRAVAGRLVVTLEGLGTADAPHPLQQGFIDEQALQCGYCVNGVIITAAALLDRNPNPTEAEVKSELAGHLCRCGAQPRMIRAILRAASSAAGQK